MASRRVEERDEIEKAVHRANSCTLRDEVNKNTSKTELEVTCMSRDELMASAVNIRRGKEAETWVGTTKSVRRTPTGSPGRKSDRIRSSMVDKRLESCK